MLLLFVLTIGSMITSPIPLPAPCLSSCVFSELGGYSNYLFLSFHPSVPTHSRLCSPSQVPPPHSCAAVSLCLLHGFVLLPQCQGPGEEVTHHRRPAELAEPRPSPPLSTAQLPNHLQIPNITQLIKSLLQLEQLSLKVHANHIIMVKSNQLLSYKFIK